MPVQPCRNRGQIVSILHPIDIGNRHLIWPVNNSRKRLQPMVQTGRCWCCRIEKRRGWHLHGRSIGTVQPWWWPCLLNRRQSLKGHHRRRLRRWEELSMQGLVRLPGRGMTCGTRYRKDSCRLANRCLPWRPRLQWSVSGLPGRIYYGGQKRSCQEPTSGHHRQSQGKADDLQNI